MNFKTIVATIFVAFLAGSFSVQAERERKPCSRVVAGDYYTEYVWISSQNCTRYGKGFSVIPNRRSWDNDIWAVIAIDKENPTVASFLIRIKIITGEMFMLLDKIYYRLPQGVAINAEENRVFSDKGTYIDSEVDCGSMGCDTIYIHSGYVNPEFISSVLNAYERGDLAATDLINFRASYNKGNADFRIQVAEILDIIAVRDAINVNYYNTDPAQR